MIKFWNHWLNSVDVEDGSSQLPPQYKPKGKTKHMAKPHLLASFFKRCQKHAQHGRRHQSNVLLHRHQQPAGRRGASAYAQSALRYAA